MKKHLLLATGLMLIANSYSSQNDFRTKKQCFLGAFASPDLAWTNAPIPNQGFALIKNVKSNYNVTRIAFTTGIEALYQISSKFSLTLGLQYSTKGGKTSNIEYSQSPIASDPKTAHYLYKYRYIDIPIRLDYYFTRKKVSPFITTGLSANIFINQTTNSYFVYYNGYKDTYSSDNSAGYSAFNLQYQLGAGVDVVLKRSRIRVFPIWRISILKSDMGTRTSFITNAQAKGNLYSVGLGLNYFFKL